MDEKTPNSAGSQLGRRVGFWVLLAVTLVLISLLVHAPALKGRLFLEQDFIQLQASAKAGEWLPYSDQFSELLIRPVMLTQRNIKPGAWIYQAGMGFLFGAKVWAHILGNLALLCINALLLGGIALSLFRKRSVAAVCAVLFVLHPAISGAVSSISLGAPLLSMFWLLVGALGLLRYKSHGRILGLAPVVCCAFLAYTTDGLGLMSVPVYFFLDIVTLPKRSLWRNILAVTLRTTIVAMPVFVFMVFWLSTGGSLELIRLYVALTMFKPALISVGEGVLRLLVPMPVYADLHTAVSGFNIGQMILFAMPVFLGIAFSLIYQDRRRFFGFSMALTGLLFQTANLLRHSVDHPAYAALLLISAAGLALFLGELLAGIPTKIMAYPAIGILVALYGLAGYSSSQYWAYKGDIVHEMADDMDRLCKNLGDTVDIFLVGGGQQDALMLPAHLDFFSRYNLDKHARFSYLIDGAILGAGKDGPIGRNPQGITRLPLDETMAFFGFDDPMEYKLKDLTPLIRPQVAKGRQVIVDTNRIPPRWLLGPASDIEKWEMEETDIPFMPTHDPDFIQWFVEGVFLPLHPQIGRNFR